MAEDLNAIAIEIVAAPRLSLHGPTADGTALPRTDCNSPVLREAEGALAFVSHYAPRGRTWRRAAADPFEVRTTLQPVRLLDDPAPMIGKWIESIWRAPGGRLYGWYHAEEPADCPGLVRKLFVPHIGALVSDDDGASWRLLGELLRAPKEQIDCGFANGFVTGGYGDFCVVAEGDHFYMHYSSYVAHQPAQGVCVARYAIATRDRPEGLQHWRDGAWMHAAPEQLPQPLLPVLRGWQHADPDSFWGPALHFNRGLGCWVMLLNHAQGGRDIHQEGIWIAFNRRLADPAGWTAPRRIVKDGFWYPQIIGDGSGDGDARACLVARLFIAGISEWEIRFGAAASPAAGEIEIAKAPLDPGW
jgi:hypothetical protein